MRPFHRFAARCNPLIVVTRSRISTTSETARSVMESITTIESRAFSSKKVTSCSKMFPEGRSRTSSYFAQDQDGGPARETPVNDAVEVRDPGWHLPDARWLERFREGVDTRVNALAR